MPISRFRSTAAVAAVLAGSLTFLGAPAGAQTPCYPPTAGCVTTTSSVVTTGPTLSLSATTVARNQKVGAGIAGFQPGSSGILTIKSVEQQVGTFTMPATGAATSTITIPATIELGAHTVFAKGTLPSGVAGVASADVTVVAAGTVITGNGGSTSGGSSLARTGAVVIPTALVGIGLVLGGVALKRSSRRGKASKAA